MARDRFAAMEEPLDLTTKKVIPEIPFDNAQYFPPSRQREEYHPECPRLQSPGEDAVRGADHGEVVLTGARPSFEDAGNPRCRYFETTYHKDSVDLVNTSLRTAPGLDYPSHIGIPREEDRTQSTQQCVIKSPLYRNPRSAESPQRELLRLQGEATKNGGRHTPTQGEWAPDQQLPPGIDTPGNLSYEQEGLRVSVLDAHLWMAFNEIQTEMIINRGGRRMFPYLYISVSGLDPEGIYDVLLDILPADKRRFKFFNDSWMPVGVAEPQQENAPYVHPESPSPGSLWMARKISFARVKLTNSLESNAENVFLHSMHKYVIRITLQKRNKVTAEVEKFTRFLLQETNFIAVTAYQNSKITHLKILNNPFAKAFRGDKPRYKRQRRRHLDGKESKTDQIFSTGTDGDIASDERSKGISDSHLIFPWTSPSIVVHPNEDEIQMKGDFVTESDRESAVKKVSLSPYLLSAYRYNAGIYASLVAYHARLSELNSASDT